MSDRPNRVTCHECGAGMDRDIRPMAITYKGHTLTVQQPGWYCACGEGVLTAEDSAATQTDFRRLLGVQDTTRQHEDGYSDKHA